MTPHNIVFDLGGTNLRIARTDSRRLLMPLLLPAPRTYPALLRSLCTFARTDHEKLGAVAGGLAGPLSPQKTHLVGSTHLRFLIGKPLQRDLKKLLHVAVLLENDNALSGLGEATHGAGMGYRIVAYIGMGTGIGGSRIVDGTVDANTFGFEPGHHYLDYRTRRHAHPSAHPGDWESVVSGSAVRIRFGQRAEDVGDRRVWKQLAQETAVGLVNVTVFWSPDVLVLGGSLMKSMPLAEVRRQYRRKQKIFPASPAIRRSKLGDLAGLYGAMTLLRRPPLR